MKFKIEIVLYLLHNLNLTKIVHKKSLGSDGFIGEFYQIFEMKMMKIQYSLFQKIEAYYITLIPKPDITLS